MELTREMCCNCKYSWEVYGRALTEQFRDGICRRHAPIRSPHAHDFGKALWPTIYGGYYCGDYEARPCNSAPRSCP